MINLENNNLPILITKKNCKKCEAVKKIIKNRGIKVRELDSESIEGMAEIMYAELYKHDVYKENTPFLILPEEERVVAGEYRYRVRDILRELSKKEE